MPVADAGVPHNIVRRAKAVRGERAVRHALRAALRLRPRDAHGRARRPRASCSRAPRRASRCACARRSRSRSTGARRGRALHAARRRDRPRSSSSSSATSSATPVRRARTTSPRRSRRRPTSGGAWSGAATYRGRWREMVHALGADAEAAHLAAARLDRRRADVRAARAHRRRAQLGLPLHVDPRRVVHALRPDAPRLHRRVGGVHALGRGALRRARAGRLAADHVRHRRPARAARGGAAAPRGLPGLAPGADRQRRRTASSSSTSTASCSTRSTCSTSTATPISYDLWTQRAAADRLGVRELAAARREHLGGARRPAGVPLLARACAGWRSTARSASRSDARCPRRWCAGTTSATRSTTTSSRASGTPSARRSCSRRAPGRVDASALLMPLVRFISPTDPRWLSTLRAIEDSLVEDSLVYRYRIDDALLRRPAARRGHVLDVLVLVRRVPVARWATCCKARHFMEKMLGYANHVGLYGEELGPRARAPRQLPAGVHAPRADQRRVRSRSAAVGDRPHRVTTDQIASFARSHHPSWLRRWNGGSTRYVSSASARMRRAPARSCWRSSAALSLQ